MVLMEEEVFPWLRSLKQFIDTLPEFICIVSRDGKWIEANDFALKTCGIDQQAYKGKTLHELPSYFSNWTTDQLIKSDQQAWETGKCVKIEQAIKQSDGTYIYLELNKQPIFTTEKEPLFLFVTGRDITQHKEKEEELSVALELLESVLEGTTDAILILDTNEQMIKVNHSFERMFGWEEGSLIHDEEMDTSIIIPEEFIAESKSIINLLREGSTVPSFETQRLRKNRTRIDVSISFSAIRNLQDDVIGFCLIYRDISERKKVERALRESEAKYRVIAEHSKDLISVSDTKGGLLYCSPSHQAVFGLADYKEINAVLFSRIHRDDFEFLRACFSKANIKKKPFTFEYRLLHHKGNWVVMETNAVPVMNEWDEIESFVTISRDITATKETEEIIRKSEKLTVLGELAAGVAHEIRNPLTSLIGFAQLLKEGNAPMNERYTDIMLNELKRINEIVGELMLVAKPQAVHFEYSSITDMLESVVRLLNTQAIIKNIQIHLSLEEETPLLYCVENQLKQLFINLLKNALEAMDHGGNIVLSLTKKKGNIIVTVKDEGVGIPNDRLDKLGEPFYTTKEKGTGLGLMVCCKIVKEHNGHIHFESIEGKGTTVTVTLPIYPFVRVK
ncbi:sporulation kinase [Fictibacillus macauensis ZFHKF-1]|uniref:histidine kinase n=1 Tax=Fictibacillus macauensis ZFHKF-1 TaxID=1196324 RepID=I8UG01_9BACL|nr:PAS domain S-box protein [Fictibacillus macauensis]EIT85758.1 sporulation kinase [Fictibacillus macauensis ZFHKF-1]